MRRLCITNTYFQLIIAMQMNNTIFANDEMIVLMSDHSKDMDIICEKLNRNSIFTKVCYVQNRNIFSNRKNIDKIVDFFDISFLKENRYSYYLKDIEGKNFDEIICFNYSIDIYGLFSYLYSFNKKISVSRYEEGILSYNLKKTQTPQRRVVDKIRNLLGKASISDVFTNFYCFYPELFRGSLNPVGVPKVVAGDKICEQLTDIFCTNDIRRYYKEKYIFFTSVHDFEGGKAIGEYELVCKIADLVGKNNLLLKTHPRDTRTIYLDNGFSVDKNSSIPWEAIQMSGDFSDKVFLTATSGSVLAGSLMTDRPVKTYYMYKLCNIEGNQSAIKTSLNIENLLAEPLMQETLRNVRIVDRLEDIL